MKKDEEGQAVGYVTIGVPLPTRVKKPSINRKRWTEFAAEVEEAFNEMREAGCQNISAATFHEHGMLLTAFRPPSTPLDELVAGPRLVPMDPQQLQEQARVMQQHALHANVLSKVMNAVEAKTSSSSDTKKEDAVKSVVSEMFKTTTAEDLRTFIEFAKGHCEDCSDEECNALLPLVLKSLEEHLGLQLC